MPIVSTPFKAVRNKGDIYPSQIEKGEEVEGRLAEIAAALDALEKTERKTAPENKATKAAPSNKATKAAPESKG